MKKSMASSGFLRQSCKFLTQQCSWGA